MRIARAIVGSSVLLASCLAAFVGLRHLHGTTILLWGAVLFVGVTGFLGGALILGQCFIRTVPGRASSLIQSAISACFGLALMAAGEFGLFGAFMIQKNKPENQAWAGVFLGVSVISLSLSFISFRTMYSPMSWQAPSIPFSTSRPNELSETVIPVDPERSIEQLLAKKRSSPLL